MALTDNLVAYWKFEGDSSDVVNSHNGTDTSMVYSTAAGKINQGAQFGGAGKILVADSSDFNVAAGDWGVSFWIKRDRSAIREIFFGQCSSGGANTSIPFLFQFSAANKIQVLVANGGTLQTVTSTASYTDTTNYHHLVITRDGSNILIYIDNSLDSTTSIGAITLNDSTNNLGIGVGGELASIFFKGYMDEMAFRKGSKFTSSEVTQLYNNGNGIQYPFSNTNAFLMFF